LPETIKHIETNEITLNLRDDGIVHACIKAKTEITIELQSEWVKLYWTLTEDLRPFIFESGPFLTVTAEARRNSKPMEKKAPILCTALVVDNLAQKLLADFYYQVNRPGRPTKIFKSFTEAEKWCLEQIKNHTKKTETKS